MANKKKVKEGIWNSRKLGILLIDIQLLITIVFLGLLFILNLIPAKYLIPLIMVFILLWAFTLFTQFFRKHGKTGKIVSIIVCIILALGSYYLFKTHITISDISGASTKTDEISILVLKDDEAQSIQDAKNYMFGIQETLDRENTDNTITSVNEELDTEIEIKTYTEFGPQIDALYNKEIGAIIINEAYRESIIETYPTFTDDTKVLSSNIIETAVAIKESDKEVTKDPFVVYISGIDTYGSISSTSRSDVNIIATVNPETKQVLLTSTPRDYYVELPVSNGQKDKLTHAGIYGIDVSMETLENIYGIDIDYYVRVNFTGFEDIIDALGGITVDSDYTFTSIWGPSFTKGENNLNGEEALAFSRERFAFADGDNQRGKNQMKVIMAIIDKAASPAIVTNYTSLLGSVKGSFETNMSSNKISSLVKMQMDDTASWNVVSNSVTGTGDSKAAYSSGSQLLYVMVPDESSITVAKDKMQQVVDGETITE